MIEIRRKPSTRWQRRVNRIWWRGYWDGAWQTILLEGVAAYIIIGLGFLGLL